MSGERGRPPVGPRLEVRLPVELLAELDRRAGASGVKRAELVRELLEAALLEGST